MFGITETTPWDRLIRKPHEAAIDFACRKVEAMTKWHATHSQEIQDIGATCRRLHVNENPEAAAAHFRQATADLYRAFPEC